MASTYSQVLSQLQENAQANIPASLNNGNPNGAYNMPEQQEQAKPVLASPYLTYSATNPSPYMQSIQTMLNKNTAAQNVTGSTTPARSVEDVNLPILPQRA